MHKEANSLTLCNVVESDKADVGVVEGALAGINFCEHLVGVGAAKHGQLPHSPVTVVVVSLHMRTNRYVVVVNRGGEADATTLRSSNIGWLRKQGMNEARSFFKANRNTVNTR